MRKQTGKKAKNKLLKIVKNKKIQAEPKLLKVAEDKEIQAKSELVKIVENKEIQDNWQKYPNYAKTRYLDALASIHSVAHPCAAISLSSDKQKHWLSYNENLDPLVKNKVAMIQELLKDQTKQNYDNLLGFYLCFNVNFRPTLQSYHDRIPRRTDKNDPIMVFRKKINAFCEKINC